MLQNLIDDLQKVPDDFHVFVGFNNSSSNVSFYFRCYPNDIILGEQVNENTVDGCSFFPTTNGSDLGLSIKGNLKVTKIMGEDEDGYLLSSAVYGMSISLFLE